MEYALTYHLFSPSRQKSGLIIQPVRLGAAGWLGWPALSYKHCSCEPTSSTSLSHKRTSNDTNQPTEQAAFCSYLSKSMNSQHMYIKKGTAVHVLSHQGSVSIFGRTCTTGGWFPAQNVRAITCKQRDLQNIFQGSLPKNSCN